MKEDDILLYSINAYGRQIGKDYKFKELIEQQLSEGKKVAIMNLDGLFCARCMVDWYSCHGGCNDNR